MDKLIKEIEILEKRKKNLQKELRKIIKWLNKDISHDFALNIIIENAKEILEINKEIKDKEIRMFEKQFQIEDNATNWGY
jgi:hypothetical protein